MHAPDAVAGSADQRSFAVHHRHAHLRQGCMAEQNQKQHDDATMASGTHKRTMAVSRPSKTSAEPVPVDAEGTSSCSTSLCESHSTGLGRSMQLSALTSSWDLPQSPEQCASQSPGWTCAGFDHQPARTSRNLSSSSRAVEGHHSGVAEGRWRVTLTTDPLGRRLVRVRAAANSDW